MGQSLRILLKIIWWQPIVFCTYKSFEEAPGLTCGHSCETQIITDHLSARWHQSPVHPVSYKRGEEPGRDKSDENFCRPGFCQAWDQPRRDCQSFSGQHQA